MFDFRSKTSIKDFDLLIKRVSKYLPVTTDLPKLKLDTIAMINFHKKNIALKSDNGIKKLLDKWYVSLENGSPDYSVYSDPFYLGDIWTCWSHHSSHCINTLNKDSQLINTVTPKLKLDDVTIVDAGCGLAYTTATLKQLFPKARVVGTNLENTWQYNLAKELSPLCKFEIASSFNKIQNVDLFVTIEYFEHFLEPIKHLEEIVHRCSPRYFLIANGFNSKTIGHFNFYKHNDEMIDNRSMSRLFWKSLRSLGYQKIETNIWNNRPSIWERVK
jgi:hypothetical protein